MSASQNWKKLLTLGEKKQRIILGLMSGTSLDGVDLALTQISGGAQDIQVTLKQFITIPYPPQLKRLLQEQMEPTQTQIDRLCALHVDLGKYIATLILDQLKQWKVSPKEVDCIASHGQTLFHLPEGKSWDGSPLHATLQIGDGDQIAFGTGIITVSDFRMKDIAAGGEGAPLVPYVDFLLFGSSGKRRVLHNLGGISNLTYLPDSGKPEDILAFDTGPANVLINLVVEYFTDSKQHYDVDGSIAAQGNVYAPLLSKLLEDPYFLTTPPKSTGREKFGVSYLKTIIEEAAQLKLSQEDIVATITALTSHSIQHAYHHFVPEGDLEIYFSGGGIHNKTLMKQIKELLPHAQIQPFDALGIPPDAREAISFAVLANELLVGNTITFPGVTGNPTYTSLGKLSLP